VRCRHDVVLVLQVPHVSDVTYFVIQRRLVVNLYDVLKFCTQAV